MENIKKFKDKEIEHLGITELSQIVIDLLDNTDIEGLSSIQENLLNINEKIENIEKEIALIKEGQANEKE